MIETGEAPASSRSETSESPSEAAAIRQSRHAGLCLLVPAILSVLSLLCFASLLLAKWEALAALYDEYGDIQHSHGALPFSQNLTSMRTGAPVGPSWFTVFCPLWLSEGTVMALAVAELTCMAPSIASPRPLTRNLCCLHLNAFCQSALSAAFIALLLHILQTEGGAWEVVFAPWYASLFLQAAMHYYKVPDARGRRHGFPVRVQHVLALVVSFKLLGAFDYSSSSWSSVLWPLWAMAAFFGMSLALATCCGLPIVMRRSDAVRGHMGGLFVLGLLIASAIFFPALLAGVCERLTPNALCGHPAI